MNMGKKEQMHTMSMQEKREVNGGSLNAPSLMQLIYNVLSGMFTPMV